MNMKKVITMAMALTLVANAGVGMLPELDNGNTIQVSADELNPKLTKTSNGTTSKYLEKLIQSIKVENNTGAYKKIINEQEKIIKKAQANMKVATTKETQYKKEEETASARIEDLQNEKKDTVAVMTLFNEVYNLKKDYDSKQSQANAYAKKESDYKTKSADLFSKNKSINKDDTSAIQQAKANINNDTSKDKTTKVNLYKALWNARVGDYTEQKKLAVNDRSYTYRWLAKADALDDIINLIKTYDTSVTSTANLRTILHKYKCSANGAYHCAKHNIENDCIGSAYKDSNNDVYTAAYTPDQWFTYVDTNTQLLKKEYSSLSTEITEKDSNVKSLLATKSKQMSDLANGVKTKLNTKQAELDKLTNEYIKKYKTGFDRSKNDRLNLINKAITEQENLKKGIINNYNEQETIITTNKNTITKATATKNKATGSLFNLRQGRLAYVTLFSLNCVSADELYSYFAKQSNFAKTYDVSGYKNMILKKAPNNNVKAILNKIFVLSDKQVDGICNNTVKAIDKSASAYNVTKSEINKKITANKNTQKTVYTSLSSNKKKYSAVVKSTKSAKKTLSARNKTLAKAKADVIKSIPAKSRIKLEKAQKIVAQYTSKSRNADKTIKKLRYKLSVINKSLAKTNNASTQKKLLKEEKAVTNSLTKMKKTKTTYAKKISQNNKIIKAINKKVPKKLSDKVTSTTKAVARSKKYISSLNTKATSINKTIKSKQAQYNKLVNEGKVLNTTYNNLDKVKYANVTGTKVYSILYSMGYITEKEYTQKINKLTNLTVIHDEKSLSSEIRNLAIQKKIPSNILLAVLEVL